ncbi:MAG: hypothetical protein ACOVP8_12665, partial [Phycisphaerales bacterium]
MLIAHPVAMCTSLNGRRYATLVLGVQPASHAPPLICIASQCGNVIDPVLRDSHVFSVFSLVPSERVLSKRLSDGVTIRG